MIHQPIHEISQGTKRLRNFLFATDSCTKKHRQPRRADGEIHMQTSPSCLRGTKRLRGEHPMKTRSQDTPQHRKGMVAPTVKKQHVEFYLPEDCDAYITRPLYRKPWKSTI